MLQLRSCPLFHAAQPMLNCHPLCYQLVNVTYMAQTQPYALQLSSSTSQQLTSRLTLRIMDIVKAAQAQTAIEDWHKSHPDQTMLEYVQHMSQSVDHIQIGHEADQHLGCISFDWEGRQRASFGFQINCLSTTFVSGRGGQAGVTLALRVDTALKASGVPVHSCFCAIKVFAGKGIIRKRLQSDLAKLTKAGLDIAKYDEVVVFSETSVPSILPEPITLRPLAPSAVPPQTLAATSSLNTAAPVNPSLYLPSSNSTQAHPRPHDAAQALPTEVAGASVPDQHSTPSLAIPSGNWTLNSPSPQPHMIPERLFVGANNIAVSPNQQSSLPSNSTALAASNHSAQARDQGGEPIPGAGNHMMPTAAPLDQNLQALSIDQASHLFQDLADNDLLDRLSLDSLRSGHTSSRSVGPAPAHSPSNMQLPPTSSVSLMADVAAALPPPQDRTHRAQSSPMRPSDPVTLTAQSTTDDVQRWLFHNHFHHFLHDLEHYDGSVLMGLDQKELITICGTAEGIRMHFLLHKKNSTR
ncbi:uncharacterized protein MONBRDRAFT_29664 [Monosiga brevicollis MX1]|uniref:Grh/CP2 DB domain-containing protein n=1 Tax=Monosiga brevicollis TaxID=81824 RepID=A9VBS2_MONBE|nr:uncharacterized protein MONBRDRAFT_29664 [Monosiga brevicollis MX1]EDQ85026.1 predicted protein [Monosiga brevicollis MX1]|eukprot:XP_001750196.1 hypothetical protein [Monosiga brevicollis MX1]